MNNPVFNRRLNDVRVAFIDFIEPTIILFQVAGHIIGRGIQAVLRIK